MRPSLDVMKELVVARKLRPSLSSTWENDEVRKDVCEREGGREREERERGRERQRERERERERDRREVEEQIL